MNLKRLAANERIYRKGFAQAVDELLSAALGKVVPRNYDRLKMWRLRVAAWQANVSVESSLSALNEPPPKPNLGRRFRRKLSAIAR